MSFHITSPQVYFEVQLDPETYADLIEAYKLDKRHCREAAGRHEYRSEHGDYSPDLSHFAGHLLHFGGLHKYLEKHKDDPDLAEHLAKAYPLQYGDPVKRLEDAERMVAANARLDEEYRQKVAELKAEVDKDN